MAVKIRLERDGYIKDAYVGFSWQNLLFSYLVPAYRGDFRGFLIIVVIDLVLAMIDGLSKKFISNSYGEDYLVNIAYFLVIVAYVKNICIAFWYNKFYTVRLLNDGWRPQNNSESAYMLLKEYKILSYDEKDYNNFEKYKDFLDKIRREERNKIYKYFLLLVLIISIALFFYLQGKNSISTYILKLFAM